MNCRRRTLFVFFAILAVAVHMAADGVPSSAQTAAESSPAASVRLADPEPGEAESNVAVRTREEKSGESVALPPDLLAPVTNRTSIRAAESDAYYYVLDHARKVSLAKQKAAAARHLQERLRKFRADPANARRKFSLFADMFRNPADYQGELVTLSGYLRKLESYSADENPYGIETLYEGWLFIPDSQRNPVVVVTTEIPERIPQGPQLVKEEVVNGIEVTGYYFKLYRFPAQDGDRGAPMILARRLEWTPVEVAAAGPPPWYVYAGVLVLFFVLAYVLWRVSRQDRAVQRRRREMDAQFDPSVIEQADREAN